MCHDPREPRRPPQAAGKRQNENLLARCPPVSTGDLRGSLLNPPDARPEPGLQADPPRLSSPPATGSTGAAATPALSARRAAPSAQEPPWDGAGPPPTRTVSGEADPGDACGDAASLPGRPPQRLGTLPYALLGAFCRALWAWTSGLKSSDERSASSRSLRALPWALPQARLQDLWSWKLLRQPGGTCDEAGARHPRAEASSAICGGTTWHPKMVAAASQRPLQHLSHPEARGC